MTSRRLRICADDYGLAPGVSRAIRDLLAARRLNATSVMTLFAGLSEEAGRLRAAAAGGSASIGLHLTLTGGFVPLAAAPLPGATHLPSLSQLAAAAFSGRIDGPAVAAEIEAQFAAFEAAFGHPPHHVDGHQHAHVLPAIRPLVLAATRRRAPGAWVRDCTPARGVGIGLDAKGRVIGLLSAGLAQAAARHGLGANRGFAGAYGFDRPEAFAPVLARALARLPDGGLVMVHPGHVDDLLATRDPVTGAREVERGVLSGTGFPELLRQSGAVLA
ncbi:ChbG/HpnK family deacetylase [Aquabacter spiritensis]|uniref:ChbG/HpnK family deacetylase n=1 Tax=Aquabacter spiritensis TaxID=933073 RepID=A0A4R3LUK1_9HYPH|nr:ChbG/HpnK family deacetylase [Aquabacter spiritensis]TCT03309.1 hypothetical protein EDC64_110174 [Aquabacter spiritensis]